GVGVTRGYLRRPDWTAERFVPHPFSTEPGARLYRTSDRVRALLDGTLEFLGRFDQQVKVRGYRIELGEIEAMLNAQPHVQECVVLAREDQPGEKRLVAYLQPTVPTILDEVEAQQVATSALRHALRRSLPAYMLPTAFVWIAQFPRTSGGKPDRRAFPAPGLSAAGTETTFVAPRNWVEEMVAEIWGEVLGLKQVSIYDNFFERGGHSLRATQVISRVRESFQIELPVRSIFDAPTIAALAESIVLQGSAEADSEELETFLAHRHE
ncbi:MAG: AMP-binding protein, partial [Ktedonobacteraceae bacterium]|nr:AMP-binding protein [Ktedonobacteraceae bacterium]